MAEMRYYFGQKFYQNKAGYWCYACVTKKGSQSYLASRWVWEKFHGKIPPKAQIHHIDGDRSNNSIENLQLVPNQSEHMKMHYADSEFYRKRIEQLAKARRYDWHKSPEGRAKNRETIINYWKKRKSEEFSRKNGNIA